MSNEYYAEVHIFASRTRNDFQPISSTLWRLVESSETTAVVGLISPTPEYANLNSGVHFIRSRPFSKQFSTVKVSDIESIINTYINHNRKFNSGESEEILIDVNGDKNLFQFITKKTKYSYQTIGVFMRKESASTYFTVCF